MTPTDVSLRELEASSIRDFVQAASPYLTGRVLDFGSGKQPYRSIVEAAGGEYVPFDRMSNPGSVATTDVGPDYPLIRSPIARGDGRAEWDAILCTQVLQYVPDPKYMVESFRVALALRGRLVMTYPTTWPEIETVDLRRFTACGIRRMVEEAGFMIERLEHRGEFDLGGFRLALGGGVVAIK